MTDEEEQDCPNNLSLEQVRNRINKALDDYHWFLRPFTMNTDVLSASEKSSAYWFESKKDYQFKNDNTGRIIIIPDFFFDDYIMIHGEQPKKVVKKT